MNSLAHGKNISQVEVTHISSHGVWLLLSGTEYFMPYTQFPWFKDARVADILNVEQLQQGHLYWPELDVDLGIDSIDNPQRFPLSARCD
ncbi:MAG: DUF2442 domain-containing protein [Deltaproteobacteria bacterium]|nr:DUF2442 domain-containing protein [Deltaproteobacteria bacterium]